MPDAYQSLILPDVQQMLSEGDRHGLSAFCNVVHPVVAAEILEELDEIATAPADRLEEEVGDLLFAVVNFARHLKIDPEAALRAGNDKFERRFRAMEAMRQDFAALSLDEKEMLWSQVKERA